jgi:iron(III) transport system substrate-binding protein
VIEVSRIRAATLVFALAGACAKPPPPLPEVKVHVSDDLPAEVLRDAAARLGVARIALVSSPAEAEVVWASDPAALLAHVPRLAPGSAPAAAGADARLADPARRFLPVCARARVLLLARGGLPAAPRRYADLADRRLRGRIALAHPARGAGPVTWAAIAITYGEDRAARFLRGLAANAPLVVESDAEVRAAIASGRAAAGLAGSVDGAAGAASAAALEVVYPDQAGRGAVVLPTAVAALAGAGPGAAKLLEWLAGERAESVLVARVPGLLPLRAGVPVPVGVEPATNLAVVPLDWEVLAAEVERLRPALARWPEGSADGPGLAAPGARR